MSSLLQDIRYALRTLRQSPGFAAVAICTLALAIGANTAIFSFVDGILLKPLPYPDPDRIVQVLEKRPDGGRNGISTLNFLDWQKQNTVFSYLAAQAGGNVTLSGSGQPVVLRGARVSAHFFDVFGIKAALGRTFLPDEDQNGKSNVVVLSNVLWQNQFGSDPGILGRKIILTGEPYTVIGVLAKGSAFDRDFAQLWRPLEFKPENMTRNFHWMGALGRLKPGVTLKQAQAEMDGIGAHIASQYPDSNKGWGVSVARYADNIVGPQIRTALYVLLAATGMVLLIGCANLANLSLARGLSREREVAIRAALGAGRWRLMRQFLTETILLSLAGGALGIGLGYATMTWLNRSLPPNSLPGEVEVTLDARVLLFALTISILTGVLFGLAPALQATKPDLAGSMKEGGRGATAGLSRRSLRDALVTGEVALAFVLLVGGGLLMRSFFDLLNTDTGFDATNVLTAGVNVSDKNYPDPPRLSAYTREILDAVRAVPGVRSAALTSALPMRGWGYGMPMQIAGRPMVDRANRQGGFFKMVSPSYFQTLGIKLLRGRSLEESDTAGAPPVAVIDQRFAKKYFPKEDPLGQRILIQQIVPGKTELGPEIAWQVVGVSADEKLNGLDDVESAGVYVSTEQSPAYGLGLVVRTALEPGALEKPIAAAIHAVNKDQAVSDLLTLEQIKTESVVSDRLEATLMGVFAAAALLLAAIGIYGVISYSVAQRMHEMGVRAALGASPGNLLKVILSRGLMLALTGLALGCAAALLLAPAMKAMLYGVKTRDPMTMAAVAAILAGVAFLACLIPALKARGVDPMAALRHE